MTRTFTLAFVFAAALVACKGDDTSSTGDDTHDNGGGDTNNGGDDTNSGDTGDTQDPTPHPSWTGNWNVEIAYSYSCDFGFDNIKTNAGTGDWTLNLSGAASDLTVTVDDNDWYEMTGSGDDEGLKLCGAFPMTDYEGDAAMSGADNHICIKIDTILGDEEGTGTVTGKFTGSFGEDCTLDESPATVTK